MKPLWFQILGWPLTVIIIIGNGLVIYLITTRRKLRTKTNWFVLSLAVADFAFGLICFPNLSVCRIKDETCVTKWRKWNRIFHWTILHVRINTRPLRFNTGPFSTNEIRHLRDNEARCPLWCTWLLQEKNNDIIHNNFWVFLDILNICVCVFLLLATTQMFLITRRHAR